jgi:hypothetical protein
MKAMLFISSPALGSVLAAWKEHAEALFEAADDLPWLQRQIVFRSDKSDVFLDRGLIKDPVTELCVRARFRRQASVDLVDTAILTPPLRHRLQRSQHALVQIAPGNSVQTDLSSRFIFLS